MNTRTAAKRRFSKRSDCNHSNARVTCVVVVVVFQKKKVFHEDSSYIYVRLNMYINIFHGRDRHHEKG